MKKKYIFFCLVIIAIIVILFIYYKLSNKQNYDYPEVSISISSEKTPEKDVIIYWTVKNKSDINITFKKNNIQLCELDTSDYQIEETKEIILKPNETYNYQFVLDNLSNGYHSISMTAKCEEGTQATFKYDFEAD